MLIHSLVFGFICFAAAIVLGRVIKLSAGCSFRVAITAASIGVVLDYLLLH